MIGSQSTRGAPQGGHLGFDPGKKVKGRKRHLLADALGPLLAVTVAAAAVQDREFAYPGTCTEQPRFTNGLDVQIVRHPANRSTGTLAHAEQALWPPPTASWRKPSAEWSSARPLATRAIATRSCIAIAPFPSPPHGSGSPWCVSSPPDRRSPLDFVDTL